MSSQITPPAPYPSSHSLYRCSPATDYRIAAAQSTKANSLRGGGVVVVVGGLSVTLSLTHTCMYAHTLIRSDTYDAHLQHGTARLFLLGCSLKACGHQRLIAATRVLMWPLWHPRPGCWGRTFWLLGHTGCHNVTERWLEQQQEDGVSWWATSIGGKTCSGIWCTQHIALITADCKSSKTKKISVFQAPLCLAQH